MTLLLDAPLDVGASRISNRERPITSSGSSGRSSSACRAAYLSLAAEQSDRIKIVDAALPLIGVQRPDRKHKLQTLIARFSVRARP